MLLVREDEADEFGEGRGLHFMHDLGAMRLDCLNTYLQVSGDLLVGFTADHQLQHLAFARGQCGQAFVRNVRLPVGVGNVILP